MSPKKTDERAADRKRRLARALEAEPTDETAAGALDRETERTGDRPPPVRLRVEDHQAIRDLAREQVLELADAVHRVVSAGVTSIRHDYEGQIERFARRLQLLDELGPRVLPSLGLSRAEACFLCDVLNGTASTHLAGSFLALEISDACSLNCLDAKWRIDGVALRSRAATWSHEQVLALLDAAGRFWHEGLGSLTDEALQRAGFRFVD